MTRPRLARAGAAGPALVRALERRFRTTIDDVTVGDRTFSILKPANADDLIREEDFVKDERLPYWADVWPSSVILAEKLLGIGGEGKKALELGCGVGLCTIAAMVSGFDVLATDYYQDALDVTRANVFRNFGVEARTRLVDWRHLPADLGAFDLVFASDVLYEREYAAILPLILSGALSGGGAALVADPGRVAAPVFLDACAGQGLRVQKKETRRFEAGQIGQSIDIFEIVRG